MKPEEQVPSQSAKPVFENTEFVIQEEVVGTQIDTETFRKAVHTAVSGFRPVLDMEAEDCYLKPAFTAESPEVAAGAGCDEQLPGREHYVRLSIPTRKWWTRPSFPSG